MISKDADYKFLIDNVYPTSKRILTIYLVAAGVAVVFIAGLFVDDPNSVSRRTMVSPFFVCLLTLQCAVYFLYFFLRRGLTRRLAAASGRLCPRCEYPLPGAVDGVCVCPECGHKDTEENIRATWKKWGYSG